MTATAKPWHLTADSGARIRFRVMFQSTGSISAVFLAALCVCMCVVVEKGTVAILSSHKIVDFDIIDGVSFTTEQSLEHVCFKNADKLVF